MIELLTTMSLTQVVIFTFLIFVAVKECISVWEFFQKKIKGAVKNELSEKELIEQIHDKVIKLETEVKEQRELDNLRDERLKFLEEDTKQRKALHSQILEFQEKVTQKLERQDEILLLLTDADREDTRSWIVQQYHYFCEQKKWIDDFSMDALEKRYIYYQQEGGNSYITGLMEQLRSLPRTPQ